MGIFDKAKEVLNSDKGEEISDKVLDKASELAKGTLGEKYSDKIDGARDSIDEKIGKNEA
ncbi:antitoxin [Corynebacterium flavescens]|uniref:antitoxin n=1 Tax=Corynebacterium flavescens TaxID=28028 RepID=UPI003FD32E67